MVTKDGSLFYTENFRLLRAFLDNSEDLQKLRTKITDTNYAVNAILAQRIGTHWMVSFIAPERLKPKVWLLSKKSDFREFTGLFKEILTEQNLLMPFFLKFSKTVDDNIFLNLETKNFLYKIFTEAGGFKEES